MKQRALICIAGLSGLLQAHAGMTVYDLNDVVRLRLEDASFFALLLLVCSLGIKLIWNYLAKGIPALPRINFLRAACLTGVLSLMMLLVLSMISGARELLTPGVWRRQGSAYRLNDTASEPLRRQSLEFLRAALRTYADQHGGKFPPHDFVPEIDEKTWMSPDSVGTRYIYVAGLNRESGPMLLACEPITFGEQRLALMASGEIKMLSTSEIRQALGRKGQP
jgi:hypothetical protein